MTTSVLHAITTYVEATSGTRSGIAAIARWARCDRSLARPGSLRQLVRTVRAASPADQDRLLAALVRVAAEDQLAQLAVTACLARHLSGIVRTWERHGASAEDLAAMEADLVSACWEATVLIARAMAGGEPAPKRLGLVLIDRARDAVRAERKRELRTQARRASLDAATERGRSNDVPVLDRLSAEIGDAVRCGRISASSAVPVFLTRVAGYSTAEVAQALGHSTSSLRTLRLRAERRLAA